MKNVVQKDPKFVIYTGPMFSSKTSRMLAALDRMTYQDKRVVVFKPNLDRRYSENQIVTHLGHVWPAICVSSGNEIFEAARDAQVVAVDEAFMIDGVAEVLINLFKSGKSVYVSSIQLSARGEPFEETQKMFPWATRVVVCSAVCPVTKRDAYYTVAKQENLDNIDVGGADKYEPRCHQQTFFMKSGE